jgi:hypothetical protein
VIVYSRIRVIRRIAIRMNRSQPGRIYFAIWKVPLKPILPLKFCVLAWDTAGNAAARSCARVSVN